MPGAPADTKQLPVDPGLDLHSAGKLDLDPPYQRRSVWNMQYKQFFIDSLIRNYPAPSIFLQVDYLPGQPAMYHVIDGKQRLTALFSFYNDEFSTADDLADIGVGDRYYSELPDDVKIALLEYVFTVESIKNASPAELNQAFDRLNRNVARLNKQELRHAKYGGAFIRKVEALAEHPFWMEIGLVTPARIRRMLDVEYVSELYILAMDGIQDGKDYLDQYYAENDVEINNEQETDKLFAQTQSYVQELASLFNMRYTRFGNIGDFYALWAALVDLTANGELPSSREVADRLAEFNVEIEMQATDRARRYRISAVQGSNKKPNREARATALKSAILGR